MHPPTRPPHSSPRPQRLVGISLIAGAVSGVFTRILREYTLMTLAYAAAMGLIPLYGVVSDATLFPFMLMTGALGAGLIGTLIGRGIHRALVGPAVPEGRQWRRTFGRWSLLLWPLVALFRYLGDQMWSSRFSTRYILVLWAVGGAVGGVLAWWRVHRLTNPT